MSASENDPVIRVQRDPKVRSAIKVDGVTVRYRTTYEKTPTFKKAIVRFGRGERAVSVVEALKNLSFDVPEGTALGVIGANGAGKSTLMRSVGGVLAPTEGRIEVRGEVSMLTLGVGFNGNLTGRENVVLGGLAGGLSRAQVEERADEIAAFAEIGDVMDLPIRTYSSGMYQRLAFSVAVHMEPDILIVDEALSAGDAAFREKAAARMKELMGQARAMILVSHSLGSIKEMCDEVIWMHKGRLMMHASADECIDAYTKFLHVGENAFTMDDM